MLRNIVYEDDYILVIHKPAGIATQTARLGQRDMVSEIKNYLAEKTKEKNPYLGLVHRLDQPVTGLLVFAKDKKSAAHISRQIEDGRFHKFYYAVIFGRPEKTRERLINYLSKDERTNLSRIVNEETPGAKRAELAYQLVNTVMALEMQQEVSLVEVELFTGRHHQIRVQMSGAGLPLLGDSKYGSEEAKEFSREIGCRNVALCAYRLEFIHPVTGKKLCLEKTPEEEIFLPFFSNGISYFTS